MCSSFGLGVVVVVVVRTHGGSRGELRNRQEDLLTQMGHMVVEGQRV